MELDWEQDVASSNVAKVGYAKATESLYVTWKGGKKRSVYTGVPEHLAKHIVDADSVGVALRKEILPNYAHHYE